MHQESIFVVRSDERTSWNLDSVLQVLLNLMMLTALITDKITRSVTLTKFDIWYLSH